MPKKLLTAFLFFTLFSAASIEAVAGSCPLSTDAYKAPKDAKFISLQVRMPDGETVDINSKSNSFISVTHRKTGESYTFKVNTRKSQVSVEVFNVSKSSGRPVLSEVLQPKLQNQGAPDSPTSMLVSSKGLQFNVISVSDTRPELPIAQISIAGKCCIDCGSWEVCCCCCCACGSCCNPV